MPDLDEQIRELVTGVKPVTAQEVIAAHSSLPASATVGEARYRRSRRMNIYAMGAAAMATAICVLVVVLVFGYGVTSSPSKRTVLTPARPSFVPASWQKVTFGGLTMYAPGNWRIISDHIWSDCGTAGQPVTASSVLLNTGAQSEVVMCPDIASKSSIPFAYGLVIDPGSYGPLYPGEQFDKCMSINGLSVCPTSTKYGGIVVLAVHILGRAQPVAVEIGLAGGGKVAHTIEYSMRATGSKVPTMTPTTIPLSTRAKPCANGAVAVKPGRPTDSMTEMWDIAVTIEFVNLSSRQCTVRGLPRYFDQLPDGQFVPLVERFAYFGLGTAPPPTGVPVLLPKDGGGFASFKLSAMTVSGMNTCHDPGKLVIQAPGQSARTQVAEFAGGITVCPNDQVFEQPVSAVDPFFNDDHPSP